jgi:hypothetical protein
VFLLFAFQSPKRRADNFAGIFIAPTLDFRKYKSVQFFGQINVARRHGPPRDYKANFTTIGNLCHPAFGCSRQEKWRLICDRSRLGFEGGSHLLENKTLAALDKSTSKCIFTLCKYEPMPAARNMLFHPSVVRNHAVPCCGDPRPAGRQDQSGRLQRQKLGQTCLVLAFNCWWGTATTP